MCIRDSPLSFRGWTRQVAFSSSSSSGNGKEGDQKFFVTLCGDAAHAMPPFLGQGANQAIQDAFCLAQKISEYNNLLYLEEQGGTSADKEEEVVLNFRDMLKDYERTRWSPTASITAKSALLGYLEASSGPLAKFRDLFFFTMNKLGVAKKIYISAAVPKT